MDRINLGEKMVVQSIYSACSTYVNENHFPHYRWNSVSIKNWFVLSYYVTVKSIERFNKTYHFFLILPPEVYFWEIKQQSAKNGNVK